MTKEIKISEEFYNKLKDLAEDKDSTVSEYIEYLIEVDYYSHR